MSVKCVILCGGKGTRIRDVADDIPKPLINIGERPILWHIMKLYAHYGVKDFVLLLGYKGWLIKEFFLNYQAFVSDVTLKLDSQSPIVYHNGHPELDWTVTLVETGLETMTGGRIWKARPYLEDADTFCVTYGDGVADLDISELLAFHNSHDHPATVTGVKPLPRFGIMQLGEDDTVPNVESFQEKPTDKHDWVNGGFFVFDHRLWDYMTDDTQLVFEKQPLVQLADAGQLAMYRHDGFWQPMDTYRDWLYLNNLWTSGAPPWKR